MFSELENILNVTLFGQLTKGNKTFLELIMVGFMVFLSRFAFKYLEEHSFSGLAGRLFKRGHTRRISYSAVTSAFGNRMDPESKNNRVLQKAIMFSLSSIKSWKNADVVLESSDVVTLYPNESLEKHRWVKLPTINDWVTVKQNKDYVIRLSRQVSHERTSKGTTSTVETFIVNARVMGTQDPSNIVDEYIDSCYSNFKKISATENNDEQYVFMPWSAVVDDEDIQASIVFKRYVISHERTFDTFYHARKQDIQGMIHDFKNKTGKFAMKGFPYKLGFALYGPPGTGKTSFIRTLASVLNRHVMYVCLDKIKNNQELIDIMYGGNYQLYGQDIKQRISTDKFVFVFEDIDVANEVTHKRATDAPSTVDPLTNRRSINDYDFLNPGRRLSSEGTTTSVTYVAQKPDAKKLKKDSLTMSGVLNALDGLLDTTGRVVVITTNHPERLDPAILRPGRVNMKIKLGYIMPEQALEMLKMNYPDERVGNLDLEIFRKAQISPAHLECLCAQFDTAKKLVESIEPNQDYSKKDL